MKKNIYTYPAIITLAVLFISFKTLVRNKQMSEILLINIECLATPEQPEINCFHFGSVDCPMNNIKVLYYW